MIAISVKQPWAALIIQGRKLREHRRIRLPLGSRIAVHASRQIASKAEVWLWFQYIRQLPTSEEFDRFYQLVPRLPTGAIIGTVKVIGHVRMKSPWGDWCSKLANPEVWEPISAAGRPGIWHWEPTPTLSLFDDCDR